MELAQDRVQLWTLVLAVLTFLFCCHIKNSPWQRCVNIPTPSSIGSRSRRDNQSSFRQITQQ